MAQQPAKAILFDLDGTLLDSAPDFIFCLNLLRQKHGLPALAPTLIREKVSDGANALVKLAFNVEKEDENQPPLRAELLDIYLAHLGKFSTLFEGFPLLLEELNTLNIKWGIVTNKPRLYAEKLLDILKLSDCAVLICPDDISVSKPNPEGLLLAAESLKCDANSCIYVGDHARDIEAGKRAGMKTVAARYGYIDSPLTVDQWDADWIIDHPEELISLLKTEIHPAMLNIKR